MSEELPFDPLAALEFPTASGIVEPRDHSPQGLKLWITATCDYLGLPPTELAKSAGLAASTVNRFLRTNDGNLSARTIQALLTTAREIEKGSRKDINEWLHESGPIVRDVRVSGQVAANRYLSPVEWRQGHYDIKIPIVAPFHRFHLIAFEVDDNHAAPAFPAGTVITTMYLRDQAAVVPRHGDFVTAYRGNTTDESVKLEMTIRKLVLSPSGELWLVAINPQSGIPDQYLGPAEGIEFNRLGSTQRPIGLVVASIHPHTR